jgi:predicted Zn finger-like uncharacterized protein
MILTCPECATRYQTDASHFTPDGRKVRCAKCGHVWYQTAPEPELEIAHFDEEPEPEPVIPQRTAYAPAVAAEEDEPIAQPRARSHLLERIGLGFGWAALAAIILVIGWSTLHYRQDIASLWPQSASFYKAVGVSVNTRGIKIQSGDKDAHFEKEDGQDVLVITGQLVNITSHELSVPPIRVSLSDADKRELFHWNFAPGVVTLRAGQTAAFRTRLSSPPATTRHIELRFAERSN